MSDSKETGSKESGNAPVNDQRRKVVRNLLAGAGVTAGVGALASTEWMKPVINAVVLPAHAQTSEVAAPAPAPAPAPAAAKCCPYYFDTAQNWCYEPAVPPGGSGGGPLAGGFSAYNWNEPDNCPVP